jgi:sodium transport system permease protein
MRLDWNDVRILYLREARAALRERTIVTNSILMPILLYPFMLWAMFTGITYVMGQTEAFVSRIALVGVPAEHASLANRFAADDKVELRRDVAVEAAAALVERGELDALVEVLPAETDGAALPGNFRARVTADTSKERSQKALERARTLVDRYRDEWLKKHAAGLGVGDAEWQAFTLERRNVASEREMGAFLLGLMLPLFFVIMVAIGCFYPAVDATAGERERNTWETLATVAASRLSVVTAKYLYVASFGFLAGALNLASMTLSMRMVVAPLLAGTGETIEFKVPPAAIPVMALGAVLLALFVAAGMMIFASFARTFKDGQSMITPFYMIVMLPVMFLQVPGIEFSLPLAFIPIVNVSMMVREAIGGVFHWVQIGITVAVELVTVAACLWLAAAILRFEDVMIGSYSGNIGTFVKQRLFSGRAAKASATGSTS